MRQQHDAYNWPAIPAMIRPPVLTTRTRVLGALCMIVVLGTLFASSTTNAAGTNASTPAWLKQITRLKPRPSSDLQAVKLRYAVSWSNWLRAGTIDIDFRPNRDGKKPSVRARAHARSQGAARALWRYDSDTSTRTSYEDLIPRHFKHVQTENGVKAEYDARYRTGRMKTDWTITRENGNDVERGTLTHDVDGIRDVLSSLLYLQRIQLKDNHSVVLLVQPSERLYRVTFRVLGRERREVMDRTWNTIKLDVGIRSVTDDLQLAPYSKMRRTSMWISDDPYRVPVDIQSDLFIGFVSVRLQSRTPL